LRSEATEGPCRAQKRLSKPFAAAAGLGAFLVGFAEPPNALRFAPAAHAAEKGDFDYLAPIYDSASNTVSFEGKTYTFRKETAFDLDENGTKETIAGQFLYGSNSQIFRLTTKGINWSWGVYRDHANQNSSRNFAIFDLDGKSPPKFETKLKTSEEIPLPEYLK
jgi:hypothetical protein